MTIPMQALRPAPLMLVGHGPADPAGVAEFAALTDRVRRLLAEDGVDVVGGFDDPSQPTVHGTLAGQGHARGAAVPLVLTAAQATDDLPVELQRDPATSWVVGRPLGPHPVLQELLAERVAAVAPTEGTTVLLVGPGADPDSNAEVHKVARLLWEGRGYEGVETAFVSDAAPDVAGGLARCRSLGARRVVVAPYLLFDGEQPRRVVAQARAFAADHPDLDVRTAGHLGDSDALAGLVVERYREALHGDIRTNCDTCAHRVLLPGGAAHGHGHS